MWILFQYTAQINLLSPYFQVLFGTPIIIYFPFGTNGKLIILEVPNLSHITVIFSIFTFPF